MIREIAARLIGIFLEGLLIIGPGLVFALFFLIFFAGNLWVAASFLIVFMIYLIIVGNLKNWITNKISGDKDRSE